MEHSTAPLDIVDPLARQFDHFGDVILGRCKPFVSAYDGLQNLRVIDVLLQAARTGRIIEVL
ncbi:MAG: hypothetical protein JSS57_00680 [Proteobacteria bacterium]|nr:hypothetical protein [Pseudomonadota bacterium]